MLSQIKEILSILPRKWRGPILIAVAIAAAIFAFRFSQSFFGLAEVSGARLVLSYVADSWRNFFYQSLGLPYSLSVGLGEVFGFLNALAIIPLVWLSYSNFKPSQLKRGFSWGQSKDGSEKKFDLRLLALLFSGYVFVFALSPFLKYLYGGDVCINQATGVSAKWYIWAPDGKLKFSDHEGFDPATGIERKHVTVQICQIREARREGISANLITKPPREILFFNPNSGRPKVWYSRLRDGHVRYFNAPGFDPVTDETLKPVTRDLVKALHAEWANADAAAAKKEAERLRKDKLAAQRAANLAQQKEEAEKAHETALAAEQAKKDRASQLERERLARERRLNRLGATLRWTHDKAGRTVIKVLSLRRGSPLVTVLEPGDLILQVNYQALHRVGDPRALLNRDLTSDRRLDFLIERGEATYSGTYRM